MSSPAKTTPSRIADVVGAANVTNDPRELAAYEVDGVRPSAAARPGAPEEAAELVKLAATGKLAVIPTGARTKLGIGMPPARYDLAIDTTRLDRVISYDPGDLTVSIEAGMPLAKLAATLAEHRQFLPLSVPFQERATVGGTLASGVDSPLRQAYGTARDFVLGMEFATGDGALAKSGGRVVKNVSGYDLHKLMLGAIGSLGIITRVNFKTFPMPATTRGWLAGFSSAEDASEFALRIRQSPLAPQTLEILGLRSPAILAAGHLLEKSEWAVAISAAGNGRVMERCAGDLETMARGTATFVALDEQERPALWQRIREFSTRIAEESPGAALIRLSVLPTEIAETLQMLERVAAENGLPGAALARGNGVLYFALLPAEDGAAALPRIAQCAKEIFAAVAKNNDRAMIPWCALELKREINIWGAPREDFPLMQRAKQAFDPHNIFVPGRFVGGL